MGFSLTQRERERESYDKNLLSGAGRFSVGETRWRTSWTDPCAGSRNWVFQSDQTTDLRCSSGETSSSDSDLLTKSSLTAAAQLVKKKKSLFQ